MDVNGGVPFIANGYVGLNLYLQSSVLTVLLKIKQDYLRLQRSGLLYHLRRNSDSVARRCCSGRLRWRACRHVSNVCVDSRIISSLSHDNVIGYLAFAPSSSQPVAQMISLTDLGVNFEADEVSESQRLAGCALKLLCHF